jgi:hypothetical protein
MKRLFLFMLASVPVLGFGQIADSAESVRRFERNAYRVLTVWGTTGVLYGGTVWANGRPVYGSTHAVWGAINAGIGLLAARDLQKWNGDAPEKRLQSFARVLKINTFIDVGYIAAGALLYGNSADKRQQEAGRAILVQGTWLFLFDAYLWHRSRKALNNRGFHVGPASQGLGINFAWK